MTDEGLQKNIVDELKPHNALITFLEYDLKIQTNIINLALTLRHIEVKVRG
jgi:hypothetical protein